jgi:hypothetical protein
VYINVQSIVDNQSFVFQQAILQLLTFLFYFLADIIQLNNIAEYGSIKTQNGIVVKVFLTYSVLAG